MCRAKLHRHTFLKDNYLPISVLSLRLQKRLENLAYNEIIAYLEEINFFFKTIMDFENIETQLQLLPNYL